MDIKELTSLLMDKQVAIVGKVGSGKTSLIHKLKEEIDKTNYSTLHVEELYLSDFSPPKFPDDYVIREEDLVAIDTNCSIDDLLDPESDLIKTIDLRLGANLTLVTIYPSVRYNDNFKKNVMGRFFHSIIETAVDDGSFSFNYIDLKK